MPKPPEHLLSWAARAMTPDATRATARVPGVREVRGLRDGTNPWLIRFGRGGKHAAAVLKSASADCARQRTQIATQAAALVLAEDHGLPALRLLAADLDGTTTGTVAMLTTVLPGSSEIPVTGAPGRLRRLGAVAAALHAIPLSPGTALPLRTRSLPDMDFAAWRRSTGTSELLRIGEQVIDEIPVPTGVTVFVHGDLWQGNTMWHAGSCTGLIDWDCAGAGSPGIDLGSLRLDAALYFGLPAAREVLAGWEQAAGRAGDQVAYWDVAAALCTVGDMADYMPPLADHGRLDLDAGALTERRDAFLGAALARLGRL